MNIKPNSKNEPDILGYEMKKQSRQITLGDWTASEYLFSKEKTILPKEISITRKDFISYFGNGNSWSGKCVPKYNKYNEYGQILKINENNDICIYYSYSEDKINKNNIPDLLKKDNILIAIWKKEKISKHIDNKFNQKGFFIIYDDKNVYNKIGFGNPFDYKFFVECVKSHDIYLDSGMTTRSSRNRSVFRSSNKFWNTLINEYY